MSFSFRKILSNIAYFKKDAGSDLALECVAEEAVEATPGKKRRHSAPGTPTSEKTDFKLGEYDTRTRKYTTVKRTMANTVLYFRGKTDEPDADRVKSPQLPDVKKLRLDCYRSPSIQIDCSDSDDFAFPSRESSPEFSSMTRDDGLEKDILEAMRESPDAAQTKQKLKTDISKYAIVNLASKINVFSSAKDLNFKNLCSNFKADRDVPEPVSKLDEFEKQVDDTQRFLMDFKWNLEQNEEIFDDDEENRRKFDLKVNLVDIKSNIDRVLTKHFQDIEVPKRKKNNTNRRRRNYQMHRFPEPSGNYFVRTHKIMHSSPLERNAPTSKHEQTIQTSSLAELTLQNHSQNVTARDTSIILSSYASADVSQVFKQTAEKRMEFYTSVHKIECQPNIEFDARLLLENLWPPSDKSEISLLTSELNDKLNVNGDKKHHFTCAVCSNYNFPNELLLLDHIHSIEHLEKLHFTYKVSYIKDCIEAEVQILPSTTQNPMKYYRDTNKIVCFGNETYACSVCYVDCILGESQLIRHISGFSHIFKMQNLIKN